MIVEYLQEESLALPGIRHGFFTRNGGVSEGIYASLNCGLLSDDDPKAVTENRRRVAEAMGVMPEHLITLKQVHGNTVVVLDVPPDEPIEADALVTKTPGLALGILTADCAPILFADAKSGVIGAAHAGWKGALAGIMTCTIQAMETLGAERQNIVAAIGSCIAQKSYEVNTDFRAHFLKAIPESVRLFEPSAERAGHFQFDLPGFVQWRLHKSGVKQAKILAKDTCFLEDAFFSNRRRNLRSEPDFGRQVSVIVKE